MAATNYGCIGLDSLRKTTGYLRITATRQYETMACVRDIFFVSPESEEHKRNLIQPRPFSGPFKQWVEWMEWSFMHGLEHFLLYTFEGTDLAALDLMKPYLDAGIASRVHFQSYPLFETQRQGHIMNDCLYRAKNHAKWLVTSLDVDEYLVFPDKTKYFNWDHLLKQQGVSEDKVASLQVNRVCFARAHPECLEISSDHRAPGNYLWRKQILKVDSVYRTWIHGPNLFKAGTAMIRVDPKSAIIHHYRLPDKLEKIDYEHYDFNDPDANITDATLQKDMPLLEAAIATRFNVQASAVKGFLKKLALRHPPMADKAAVAHKMPVA